LVFIGVGVAVGIGVDSGSAGGLALPENQRPQPVGRTLRVSRLFLYPAMTECLSPTTADSDPDPDFHAAAARKSLVGSAPWRLNPFSVLPAVVDDARGMTVDDNGAENGE